MVQFLIKKDSEVKFENAIPKYMEPLHKWNSFRMHILQFYYAVDMNHQIKTWTDNFTPARTYNRSTVWSNYTRLRKWIQVYIYVTSSTTGIFPLTTSNSNARRQSHDEILRWYLIYKRVVNRISVLGRHVIPTPRSSYSSPTITVIIKWSAGHTVTNRVR